ncbi:winged helix-turn-helix transcriptional regulator [Asticcacaulis solisilvae]|uniref:winged helix-turn-helix transcriptional regulator n=1 Tax=Asticcacaulis solisilvae TaxID=1217274 RepID=UPI003FD6F24F
MPRQKKSTTPPAPPPPRSRLIRGDAPKAKAVKPLPPRAQKNRSLCPINLVLEAVGDSWSMLIVRDLMLRGHTSYQAFLRSDERIATNILADRLQKLEQNGLISKAADPADARKYIYALTSKGADLAPLLVEMTLFSLKHEQRIDMPKEIVAEMQKNKQGFAGKLVRNFTPRTKAKSVREAEVDPADETLSLF